jgi:uncharacterized integral membrane protein
MASINNRISAAKMRWQDWRAVGSIAMILGCASLLLVAVFTDRVLPLHVILFYSWIAGSVLLYFVGLVLFLVSRHKLLTLQLDPS